MCRSRMAGCMEPPPRQVSKESLEQEKDMCKDKFSKTQRELKMLGKVDCRKTNESEGTVVLKQRSERIQDVKAYKARKQDQIKSQRGH